MASSRAADLKRLLTPDRVLTEPEDTIPYSFDGTAGLYGPPSIVVFARTSEEISRILRWANEVGVPIVTRGAGTGLSGGSVPVKGCVVLCTVQMDRILEVDEGNLTLLAEPGVITQTIADTAQRHGLFYPPDPGSIKISTIGGNVAENSGGLRGLKYGVTRDYVMGLEVVLPTGEITWLGGKNVKDVAGFSLKDLFVGSEGLLGVITRILLKLVPQPAARKTLLCVYNHMERAAETASAIIRQKIIPCTMEFLDQITINCVEDYARIGLPREAAAILLIESDGHPALVNEEARQIETIARACGAVSVQLAQSSEEAMQLATARRTAFAALARVRPTTILEDATVPRTELVRMIQFIQEVAARHDLKIGTFGHMGDGNLHPTFLTDERNEAEMGRVKVAMEEIFAFAVALGGTITGEHGVGLAKKEFLPRAVGEINLRLMRELKRTLDPNNLLNPGKVFD